jgi:hypothetical protein
MMGLWPCISDAMRTRGLRLFFVEFGIGGGYAERAPGGKAENIIIAQNAWQAAQTPFFPATYTCSREADPFGTYHGQSGNGIQSLNEVRERERLLGI